MSGGKEDDKDEDPSKQQVDVVQEVWGDVGRLTFFKNGNLFHFF